MSDIRHQVSEFHRAFDIPIADKPHVPTADVIRLRLRLIAEEFFELMASCGIGTDHEAHVLSQMISMVEMEWVNLQELVDALADLDYVIEGARQVFGIDGAPIAAEVHRANMAKLGPDGKPILRGDGKVVKPNGWEPPDIAGELEKQGWVK